MKETNEQTRLRQQESLRLGRKKPSHKQVAYKCVGGPHDGEIQTVRQSLDGVAKAIRLNCDQAAYLKDMQGYYRSTDGSTMYWVSTLPLVTA